MSSSSLTRTAEVQQQTEAKVRAIGQAFEAIDRVSDPAVRDEIRSKVWQALASIAEYGSTHSRVIGAYSVIDGELTAEAIDQIQDSYAAHQEESKVEEHLTTELRKFSGDQQQSVAEEYAVNILGWQKKLPEAE
jgi:hypothetical protein